MKNSNETSLQVVENTGILKKIMSFIKKLFVKENISYITTNNENKTQDNKNLFFKSIKFEEDPDKAMLLKIQDEFEKKGINEENAYNLTKELSVVQKEKLLNLYEEQIRNYEISIENHKNNILAIRKRIAQ